MDWITLSVMNSYRTCRAKSWLSADQPDMSYLSIQLLQCNRPRSRAVCNGQEEPGTSSASEENLDVRFSGQGVVFICKIIKNNNIKTMNDSVMTHQLKTCLFQSCFFTINNAAVTIETSLGLNLAVTRFVIVVWVPLVSVSSKNNKKGYHKCFTT